MDPPGDEGSNFHSKQKTPSCQKDEALVSWYHLMFTKRLTPFLSLQVQGKLSIKLSPIAAINPIYPSTITCAGIRHSLLCICQPSCSIRLQDTVWCEAQRCIHRQFSTRLSSSGCFLCAASACYLFLSSLFFMKLKPLYWVFSRLSTSFKIF